MTERLWRESQFTRVVSMAIGSLFFGIANDRFYQIHECFLGIRPQIVLFQQRKPGIDSLSEWIEIERRILGFAVIREMPADAVQFQPSNVRSIDRRIAAFQQFFLDESLEQIADHRSLGHPQDQALPDLLTDGE